MKLPQFMIRMAHPSKNKSPVLVSARAQHNPVLNISNESMVNIKGSRSDNLMIGGHLVNASEAVRE